MYKGTKAMNLISSLLCNISAPLPSSPHLIPSSLPFIWHLSVFTPTHLSLFSSSDTTMVGNCISSVVLLDQSMKVERQKSGFDGICLLIFQSILCDNRHILHLHLFEILVSNFWYKTIDFEERIKPVQSIQISSYISFTVSTKYYAKLTSAKKELTM